MSEAKHYFVYTTKEKLEEIGATDIYESKQPNGMTIFNAELTHDFKGSESAIVKLDELFVLFSDLRSRSPGLGRFGVAFRGLVFHC